MKIIFKNTIKKIIYLEENLKFVRLEKEKIEAFANKDEDIFTCFCKNGARTVEYYSHSASLIFYLNEELVRTTSLSCWVFKRHSCFCSRKSDDEYDEYDKTQDKTQDDNNSVQTEKEKIQKMTFPDKILKIFLLIPYIGEENPLC